MVKNDLKWQKKAENGEKSPSTNNRPCIRMVVLNAFFSRFLVFLSFFWVKQARKRGIFDRFSTGGSLIGIELAPPVKYRQTCPSMKSVFSAFLGVFGILWDIFEHFRAFLSIFEHFWDFKNGQNGKKTVKKRWDSAQHGSKIVKKFHPCKVFYGHFWVFSSIFEHFWAFLSLQKRSKR